MSNSQPRPTILFIELEPALIGFNSHVSSVMVRIEEIVSLAVGTEDEQDVIYVHLRGSAPDESVAVTNSLDEILQLVHDSGYDIMIRRLGPEPVIKKETIN